MRRYRSRDTPRGAGHPTPAQRSPSRQTAQKWRELDGNCCAASRYIQDGGNRRRRRYNERLLFPPNYQEQLSASFLYRL